MSILLSLDSERFLNWGRAPPCRYRLVCHREVWSYVLKGIPDFIAARLNELVQFGVVLRMASLLESDPGWR